MRVLVCGGREYTDSEKLFYELDRLHREHSFTLLIQGGASGADRHAKSWAISRGVRVQEFPARWGKYGKAAGPMRNQRMLNVGKPELVVAFPGGSGTADMVCRATWAGVKVMEIA